MRPSQNERLLAILSDGEWHTTAAILRRDPMMVHSRVAEINGRGTFRIEHDGAGGGAENHRYRLVGVSDEGAVSLSAAAALSSGALVCGLPDGGRDDGDAGASSYVQLRLVA